MPIAEFTLDPARVVVYGNLQFAKLQRAEVIEVPYSHWAKRLIRLDSVADTRYSAPEVAILAAQGGRYERRDGGPADG